VSRELHLITRERPAPEALAEALAGATGGAGASIEGDFADPDSYLNVSGSGLWFEVEAPGHVEVVDLRDGYPDGAALPEPDEQQCLWLTTASIPLGAPPGSAGVAVAVFGGLATRYDGTVIEP
jgi:hypothetical protein